MRKLLVLLLALFSFGAVACGDDLPDNCGRNDDGEVICANGDDDNDGGGWSDDEDED